MTEYKGMRSEKEDEAMCSQRGYVGYEKKGRIQRKAAEEKENNGMERKEFRGKIGLFFSFSSAIREKRDKKRQGVEGTVK